MAVPRRLCYCLVMGNLSRRAGLLLASMALVAAGCSSGGDSSGTVASGDAPTTTVTVAATTTTAPPRTGAVLEDAGAPPRQPLVLALAAGSTARITMVSKVDLQLTVDGRAVPAQATPGTSVLITQRVERVDPDGTAHVTMSFGGWSVVSTTGVDPAVVKAVRDSLAQVKNVQGTGTVNARGETGELKLDTSGVGDPAIRNIMDSLASQAGDLSAPFPREPVGAGARWTVKRSAILNGLRMDMTTRYTLRSRTGDRYVLDVTQDAVSPPGPADLPGLPVGARATIESFTMQSKGQVSGELSRGLPSKSSTTGSGGGTFTFTAGTERSTMRQQLTIEITVAQA